MLVLSDIPVGHWIAALIFFALLFLCGVAWFPGIWRWEDDSVLEVVFLMLLLVGVIWFANRPITETMVDRNLRRIAVNKSRILGSKYLSLSFEEVSGGAILQRRDGSDGENLYLIDLLLNDGGTIALTQKKTVRDGDIAQAVKKINEFLGVHASAGDYQLTQLTDD